MDAIYYDMVFEEWVNDNDSSFRVEMSLQDVQDPGRMFEYESDFWTWYDSMGIGNK